MALQKGKFLQRQHGRSGDSQSRSAKRSLRAVLQEEVAGSWVDPTPSFSDEEESSFSDDGENSSDLFDILDSLNLGESKTEETGDQKMTETNKVRKKWYTTVGSSDEEETSDGSSVTSSEEQLDFSPIF